jgi:hypothetical protein
MFMRPFYSGDLKHTIQAYPSVSKQRLRQYKKFRSFNPPFGRMKAEKYSVGEML